MKKIQCLLFVWVMLWISPIWATAPSSKSSIKAPYKRAIVIGNNQGNGQEKRLRYAKSDAHKLYRTLHQLGGFKTSHIDLMLGQTADRIRARLAQIRTSFLRIKRETPHRPTLLLFYYSGHADGRTLHMGSTQLGFSWLRTWLKTSPAQIRLAILDTCQSGQITRTKGARRVSKEVPLPPVIRHTTTHGMALITSSGVGEDSHEIDQLRGSVFTHYLVSGLHGAADRDRDGKVSLREAYSYAYQRTISHTIFLSSGIQHPSFRNELHGHGHLILSKPKQASAKIHFGAQLTGTYFVLNQNRNRLLAEVKKEKGRPVQIGLHSGRYTIVRRNVRRYQIQTIQLRPGQALHIRKKEMVALSYAWSASKGLRWLTHDLQSPLQIGSPYRTAFFSSIAAASLGLLTSGILFGATGATIAQNEHYLNNNLRYDPVLTARGQSLNTSAVVAISATGTIALSSVLFYVMHIQHLKKRKQTRHQQAQIASSPPPHRTQLYVRSSF